MRKISFAKGEIYHVYNRGVDKRKIFNDQRDLQRFNQGLIEFNTLKPIGSIYEQSFFKDKNLKPEQSLVQVIAYALLPNHFHLLLENKAGEGISKFIKRLAGGYSWYFNNKYQRRGTLFQGPFKAVHVDSNDYLLHLSVYINLNDHCHQLGDQVAKLVKTSGNEYFKDSGRGICSGKQLILDQFASPKEYKDFCFGELPEIIKRKKDLKEDTEVFLE